jgi:short-subunit dehydrogenase
LTALPHEGLPEVALAIERSFSVKVWVLELNLLDPQAILLIEQFLDTEQIPVQMLVNNAGVGSAAPFLDLDLSFYHLQMKLNALLPRMLKAGSPAILNISSLGSFFHIPGKEVYVATKSMMRSFSHSLRIAFRTNGLKVCVVCPGPVDTNDRVREANQTLRGLVRYTVLQPEQVAEVAVRALLNGRHEVVPGVFNRMLMWIQTIMPARLREEIIERQFKKQTKNN